MNRDGHIQADGFFGQRIVLGVRDRVSVTSASTSCTVPCGGSSWVLMPP